MKIKQEQLERLAIALLANYRAKELIIPKATEPELKAKIMAIISHNFAEEEAIEEEARAMLASCSSRKGCGSLQDVSAGKAKAGCKEGLSCEPTIGKPDFTLAHLIVDGLGKGNLADFSHEGRALSETKRPT